MYLFAQALAVSPWQKVRGIKSLKAKQNAWMFSKNNKVIIINQNRNFKQALSHKAMIHWNGNTDKIDNDELLVNELLIFYNVWQVVFLTISNVTSKLQHYCFF